MVCNETTAKYLQYSRIQIAIRTDKLKCHGIANNFLFSIKIAIKFVGARRFAATKGTDGFTETFGLCKSS